MSDTVNNTLDIDFYKSYYPDLQHLSPQDLFLHYKQFGKNEGRLANKSGLDIDFYKLYYPDLRHFSYQELVLHYKQFGKNEGRITNKSGVDTDFYKSYYPDLQNLSSQDLVAHYNIFGKNEGRISNKFGVDTDFYKSYYPDLKHLSPQELILHYNLFGKNEGRYCNKKDPNLITLIPFNAHSIFNHITCLDNDVLLKIQNNLKIYPQGDKCGDYILYRLYLSWMYDSINNKKISITSPINNKVIYTDKYFITTNQTNNSSSNFSICNYYFDNDKILLGLGLGTGNNPQETSILYIYCIDSNKILYDWLNYSYGTFISNTLPSILCFLNNNIIFHNFEIMDSKITSIYGFMNNIGHMLFNDYTGLHLIDSFGITAKIDEVIMGPYDVYNINYYFTQFKHIYINNMGSIDTLNFKIGKGVLFKYGHFHILDDTIDFLKQNLLKHVLIEDDYNHEYQLAKLQSDFIKTTYFPIINIVLRKGDFEMNNQIDVISDLVNLIITKYPNAFFYFDGFVKNNKNDLSVGVNFSETTRHVCNKYIDLVNGITTKINTTNYLSLINTKILTIITHLSNCSYGIYNLSSAACVSGWICKIPGIQFGRRHIKIYEHMDKIIRENNPKINYYNDAITYDSDDNFNISASELFKLIPNLE
jgi:hypothetical protein